MRPLTGPRAEAENALAQVVEQLDEGLQYHLIDEPIDRAAAGAAAVHYDSVTHETLHRVLAELVRRLCQEGLGVPRCLSPAQAQDEAVFYLQHLYQGTADSGYEAAMAHGRLLDDGLRVVVHHLVESLKAWRRQVHLMWVRTRIVGGLDWAVRCQMAAILLERLEPYLPANVKSMDPARFAEDPLALLEMVSSTAPAALLSETGIL